jgi:hypothetical protein
MKGRLRFALLFKTKIMAGCFGNHWVDRVMESQLMRHLESEADMEINDEGVLLSITHCSSCGFSHPEVEVVHTKDEGQGPVEQFFICPKTKEPVTIKQL